MDCWSITLVILNMETCKFKSNVMFFVYPKHKETTEDISVLVSPIYKYAMTPSLRTKPVGGSGVPTCKSLVPPGNSKPKQFY